MGWFIYIFEYPQQLILTDLITPKVICFLNMLRSVRAETRNLYNRSCVRNFNINS